MERFAIKINDTVRSNLYKICRLCGMDYPDKVSILQQNVNNITSDENDEPALCSKIFHCVGIQISMNDKMPQSACILCQDKINDFFEFREMCWSTDFQIRKLLGFTQEAEQKLLDEENDLSASCNTTTTRRGTYQKRKATSTEQYDAISARLHSGTGKKITAKGGEHSRKRKCLAPKVLSKKKLKKLPSPGVTPSRDSKTPKITEKCVKTKRDASGRVTRRSFLETSQKQLGKRVLKTEKTTQLSTRKLRIPESRPAYSEYDLEKDISTKITSRKSLNLSMKDRGKVACPICGKSFVFKTRLTKHISKCYSKSRILVCGEKSIASKLKLEKVVEEKEKIFIAPPLFVVIPNVNTKHQKENIPALESVYDTSIRVKKEPVHDYYTTRQNDGQMLKVKGEVVESPACYTKNSANVYDGTTKDCNLKPALKLRIKKEHGILNSCLIEQTDGGSNLYSPNKKKKQKVIKPSTFKEFKQEDDSDVNINFACNITAMPFIQQNCFTPTHGCNDYVELQRGRNRKQDVKVPVIPAVISADGRSIPDVKIKSEFNINLSGAEQEKINSNFQETPVPKSESLVSIDELLK